MRKIILVLMAVGLLGLAMVDLVSAASTADITVTVTCRKLSVGVTPSSYAFGLVDVISETVATTSIGVSNDGNVSEDFKLKLTDPVGWTALQAGTPGTDQYILGAIFMTAAPVAADYIDSEDMLSTDYAEASTTVFAKNTVEPEGEKGYSVLASEARKLWFYFYAPALTTVGTEQSITVTVEATQS